MVADDAKPKAKLILTNKLSLYIHIKDANTTVDLQTKFKSQIDDLGFTRKTGSLHIWFLHV